MAVDTGQTNKQKAVRETNKQATKQINRQANKQTNDEQERLLDGRRGRGGLAHPAAGLTCGAISCTGNATHGTHGMWHGVSPSPGANVGRGKARSRRRCGRGEPGPGADVGRAEEPSPGADVGRGEPGPGADVGDGVPRQLVLGDVVARHALAAGVPPPLRPTHTDRKRTSA